MIWNRHISKKKKKHKWPAYEELFDVISKFNKMLPTPRSEWPLSKKERREITNAAEDAGKGNLPYCWWDCKLNEQPLQKTVSSRN